MNALRLAALSAGLTIVVVWACCLIGPGITIVAASAPTRVLVTSGPLRFEEHLVMDKYTCPYGVAAADLDGDATLDIAAYAERGSLEFRWWRKLGRNRD